MARKQDRIEGNYAIVSTDRPGQPMGAHTMDAVRRAWGAGCSVAIAVGVWNGDTEESLIISGPGHVKVADSIARAYLQDAYMVIAGGQAVLYTRGLAGAYQPLTVFTRRLERTNEPSYTQLGDGRQVVFAR